eukprot:scaffold82903_cov62-Attheya_sp.AAC.2
MLSGRRQGWHRANRTAVPPPDGPVSPLPADPPRPIATAGRRRTICSLVPPECEASWVAAAAPPRRGALHQRRLRLASPAVGWQRTEPPVLSRRNRAGWS